MRKPKSSNILSQGKNFVRSMRKQYGNPDSHVFLFYIVNIEILIESNFWLVMYVPYILKVRYAGIKSKLKGVTLELSFDAGAEDTLTRVRKVSDTCNYNVLQVNRALVTPVLASVTPGFKTLNIYSHFFPRWVKNYCSFRIFLFVNAMQENN